MTTERTGAGLQHVLPGCSTDGRGHVLRLASAPLKPAKPQQPCDLGLFSDQAGQSDLVDFARK